MVSKKLILNHHKIIAKLLEGTILVLFFSLFVHLLTCSSAGLLNMIVSAVMVLIAAVLAYRPLFGDLDSQRGIWTILSALAGGFWMFNFFRYTGLVQWPLAYAPDLTSYARLLYFHFVLSITVLAPLLMVTYMTGSAKMILWGDWKKKFFTFSVKPALLFTSVACWLWALYVVLFTEPRTTGPIAGFIIICLLKAFLTGATEEICYRGIIQPAAIAHFGIPLGIILQSSLYTAFHMHLGEAFFTRPVFITAVMALGLILGVVTHITCGIGWASIVHIAIGVVIEWQNLS